MLITGELNSPVFALAGVNKAYVTPAERVVALNQVDFEATAGVFICIYGASGSGKSTLLNVLSGIERPDSGIVRIGDQDVSSMTDNERIRLRTTRLGVIFQNHSLIEEFTAIENVCLPLEARGMTFEEAKIEATLQLITVGLDHLGDRYPDEMSGGQRQRVGIARALAGNRKILLADEPTGALDSENSRALFKLIRGRCDEVGVTAVVCTHDPLASSFADIVYRMVDGRIARESVH